MTIIKDLFLNLHFLALFSALVTFVISVKLNLYPGIIDISKKKRLMNEPEERSIHKTLIPNLGGIGLFLTFSLSVIVFALWFDLTKEDLIKLLSLIGSAIILLFLGVKDDLVLIAPKKKFLGQFIAAANVIILTDVRITSFEGLIGIGELPYVVSVLFSLFVFILVVNALNLIDGVDGLAGSIGIISSLSFGVFFLVGGHYMMTLVSFVFIGSMMGFLRYNLSHTQKIFMGDCGSMFTGFLLAYQGILLLTLNEAMTFSNISLNAPIMLLAILSYPLLDTLRVFTIRISQKRSPFSADSNHIHHRLLNLGLNHKQTTLLISICNILVVGLAFSIGDLNINLQLFIIVLVGLLLYLTPFLKILEKNTNMSTINNDHDTIITKELKDHKPLKQLMQPVLYTNENLLSSQELSSSSSNSHAKQKAISNRKFYKAMQNGKNSSENAQKQRVLNKRLTEFKKSVKKV